MARRALQAAGTRGNAFASNTDVYRICPLFTVAVPLWQFWHVGS